MARENYSFKKHQRELAQKKKREEKLQRRLAKKNLAKEAENAAAGGSEAEIPSSIPAAE